MYTYDLLDYAKRPVSACEPLKFGDEVKIEVASQIDDNTAEEVVFQYKAKRSYTLSALVEGACEHEQRMITLPASWLAVDPALRSILKTLDRTQTKAQLHVQVLSITAATANYYTHYESMIAIGMAIVTTAAACMLACIFRTTSAFSDHAKRT
eukprot:TRINITY_DN12247_c1_g1_i1.p2 TRINITY_DN12247_c1_g1~~TRINITY_DN12247_c1_g1_i1.p2  ORF type:complete len:153 (+),score=20.77 TRINITY_DN12247_c1_g1_i1:1156-1614(+)